MKNINLYSLLFSLLLVFSSSLFFSCNQTKKENTPTDVDSVAIENQASTQTNDPTEEYQKFVSALDTTKMASSKQAAEKFKKLYANATPEQADKGFVIFNELYRSLVQNLDEQHFADVEKTGNFEKYYAIAGIYNGYNDGKDLSPEMKAKNEELASHGFGIGMTEGSTYFLQNRNFLKDYFYDKVSPAMKEYLIQKNKEAKEIFADDGGLAISPTRLAERIVWAENFVKENPNFYPSLMEELKWSKKSYLTVLFEGMDNTPLFDYETKALTNNYEQAYQTLINSYSDTETAAMIKPYYEAIKNKDKAKQKELMAKYQAEDKIYNNEY